MGKERTVRQVVPAVLEDGTKALLVGFRKGGVLAEVSGRRVWVAAKAVPPVYRQKLRERDERK